MALGLRRLQILKNVAIVTLEARGVTRDQFERLHLSAATRLAVRAAWISGCSTLILSWSPIWLDETHKRFGGFELCEEEPRLPALTLPILQQLEPIWQEFRPRCPIRAT